MRKRQDIVKRFWSKVRIGDGCWEWTASKTHTGYGRFQISPKTHSAHRVGFLLVNGYQPEVVRHSCDNKACVRPSHLLAGNHADNMRDMTDRRRQAYGERQGSARLTRKQVFQIRSDTRPRKEIAAAYGVSLSLVEKIIARKRWVLV